MTGLIYGVPQIICPGNVFERKYNESSIVKLNAGKMLEVILIYFSDSQN